MVVGGVVSVDSSTGSMPAEPLWVDEVSGVVAAPLAGVGDRGLRTWDSLSPGDPPSPVPVPVPVPGDPPSPGDPPAPDPVPPPGDSPPSEGCRHRRDWVARRPVVGGVAVAGIRVTPVGIGVARRVPPLGASPEPLVALPLVALPCEDDSDRLPVWSAAAWRD